MVFNYIMNIINSLNNLRYEMNVLAETEHDNSIERVYYNIIVDFCICPYFL